MSIYEKYEAVIGLEVHIQLLTKSKMYANDINEYGALPNTNVSVISLGHPGTLPRVNKRAIEFAVKLGLAVNANIRKENQFARKNYFYADLPKGYQITQDKTPICNGGAITIKLKNGGTKKVNLTRIHMEEDAGKSMHDQDAADSLIDLNRAGVPLLEIVSEPDIKTSDEAYAYLTEVRKLVRYLDICDGNMEEGSMRCDANVSVMLKGSDAFGKKVEVKNMNSIRNVQRAIEFEIKRQIEDIEEGEEITTATRSFNAVTGETVWMRDKESANDYRYFPEPDLQPVIVTEEYIAKIKALLPELPNELFDRFVKELNLTDYDASNLTDTKSIALYFSELVTKTKNYKAAANWMMGSVKSYLNENALTIERFPLKAERIAELIAIIDEGKISNTVASLQVFPEMVKHPEKTPMQIATDLNVIQESNSDALQELVNQAIGGNPAKVAEYKAGKVNLVGMFMGEVMKLSGGKADPKLASKLVKETLDKA
ncbi:MAG: Aspartyl/glutamyl-tRNA(Asn/Gln) amidotransferase subunit [Bacteroidetes bacterium]|jgi:aspartyl-tRNA(Asn)/glutamyl-tRNA(Gln) amidotransferase subunit B|nr:Aspartyl/glutamyl-tRNA(Asn/Gln) amidotransferase subunit [Bacteroidota bacterium]